MDTELSTTVEKTIELVFQPSISTHVESILSNIELLHFIFNREPKEESLDAMLEDIINKYENYGNDGLKDIIYKSIMDYFTEELYKFNIIISSSNFISLKELDDEIELLIDFIKWTSLDTEVGWSMEDFEEYSVTERDMVVTIIENMILPEEEVNLEFLKKLTDEMQDNKDEIIRNMVIEYILSNFSLDMSSSSIYNNFVFMEDKGSNYSSDSEVRKIEELMLTLYCIESNDIVDYSDYTDFMLEHIKKFRGFK